MDQINQNTAEREIVLSRLLDAPRELVFAAWTNPEQVVQWWGPHGFTTTSHEMSVTPGGVWRFVITARTDATIRTNRLHRGGEARASGLSPCRRGRS